MIRKIDDADLIICNYERVLDDYRELVSQDQKCLKEECWNFKQFWEHYYFGNLNVFCCVAWNKLYRKHLFDKVRYPLNKIHEDEYVINIVSQCNTIKVISDSLYYYVQRSDSIMHKSYCGSFDRAEAYLGRCSGFYKYNLNEILEANLDMISGMLIAGINEDKDKRDAKVRYSYLMRSKYNFFVKLYLKEKFSIKLYKR